jgi:hypothetical protein
MSTATTTKLSKKTLEILKNFASINSNILVNAGNVISTISPVKNVLAEAKVDETFDVQFGIWDLNKFLGTVSLFDDAEFEFHEKYAVISNSKGSSVKYFYCEPKLLTTPNKKIQMPKSVVNFKLTQKIFSELQKAASVLQLPDIAVRSNDGRTELVALDKADTTSNNYSVDLGETGNDAEFEFYFKVENLKLLPGDYKVEITEKIVSKFTHENMDLSYWIALEPDSSYNG